MKFVVYRDLAYNNVGRSVSEVPNSQVEDWWFGHNYVGYGRVVP